MKVSESWLREWVNTPLKDTELAEKLTMAGLEVDDIGRVAGDFSNVIVGHVLETRRHPKADKLNICTVDAGDATPCQIVCGASNVRANLKVALAIPGAKLPGNITIQKTELRGEPSAGMICSSSELGLEERSEGILELPDDAPVGTPLTDYLKLNDKVMTIELTPNRADCFSMRGIAREVSVLTNSPLNTPEIKPVAPSLSQAWEIHIKASDACPGYALRLIKNINQAAKTPLWMIERLRRAGIRAIHPAVDITQYIMLEFGQPMHAFDAAKVSGPVQVRFSQAGEQMTLLDGQEITLSPNVLVIADDEKLLAIAGVMGGESSAVTDETQDVLFESAFFEPKHIAGVARQYGLCTDASQRFERGVDPALHPQMLERATELLLAIAGGSCGPVHAKHTENYLPAVKINFQPTKVKALTGLEVAPSLMREILTALGMDVSETNENTWQVLVPTHRFDIALEVDLVEEIARIYGFDKLTAAPMHGRVVAGQVDAIYKAQALVSNTLIQRGYSEVISYSFVDPTVQAVFCPEQTALRLVNPLSSELSEMRLSLWPGLISALMQNASRSQEVIKCFEVGTVFDMSSGELCERAQFAGLMTGMKGEMNWAEAVQAYDFFDMKADLEVLAATLNQSLQFKAETSVVLHPGKSARVYLADIAIGWIGVLHPALVEALDLDSKHEVMLFELDLAPFTTKKTVQFRKISKYPQVRRDLSLLMDEKIPAGTLEQLVRKTIAKHTNALKSFDIFDQYTGEQVPKGQKSLAIAMVFQESARTLTEDDITPVMQRVTDVLSSELNVQVRD